ARVVASRRLAVLVRDLMSRNWNCHGPSTLARSVLRTWPGRDGRGRTSDESTSTRTDEPRENLTPAQTEHVLPIRAVVTTKGGALDRDVRFRPILEASRPPTP